MGAGVDGVEKVADVDVDVLEGLCVLQEGEISTGFFPFFEKTQEKSEQHMACIS